MNKDNKRTVLIWISAAILYWVIESCVMVLIFHEGNFLGQMLTPSGHEIWMRLITISIFIIFGIYSPHAGSMRLLSRMAEENEQKFQMLYQEAPVAFQALDSDGCLIKVNQKWLDELGYCREDVIGRWFGEYLAPQYVEYFKECFPRLKTSGKAHGVEFEMIRKDGSHISALFNGKAIYDERGNFRHTHCAMDNITERKQMAEELIKERNSAQEYLDIADVIIVVLNADGNVSLINKKGCSILEYSEEEIVGKNWFDNFLPGDIRDAVKMEFMKLIDGDIEPVEYYENAILSSNGREKIIAWHNTVLRDKAGQIYATLSSGEDVTEQKWAFEQLQKSEEKFSKAFRSSPNLMAITRMRDGCIIDVNDCFINTLGYNREELIGNNTADLRLWANSDERDILIETLKKSGRANNLEVQLRVKSGKIHSLLFSCEIVNYTDKEPHLITMANDITERKKMEIALAKERSTFAQRVEEQTAELKAANYKLRKSEGQYREMADMLPQAICETDMAGNAIFANQCALQSSGYTQVDFDNGLNVIQLVVPEERERVQNAIQRAIQGEYIDESEYTALRKDGTTYPVLVYSAAIVHNDKLVGLRNVVMDMTKYKEYEAKLLEYQKQLRSLASRLVIAEEHERRRIAVDIHDSIGQNLGLCKVRLEILRQSLSDEEPNIHISEALDLITQTIQRTRSLTFDISSPLLYDIGLEAAIEDLLEHYQEQYGIVTRLKNDNQPKPLSSDVCITVFRSVRELLINIIKHARARNVDVAIWRNHCNLNITIRDDGIGFEVPEIKHPIGKDNGFGLFSISERLNYLGGCIAIKSAPGSGTKVTIEVPLEEQTELAAVGAL